MGLVVQLEKSTNCSKVIHLNLKVVNNRELSHVEANQLSTRSFLKDFEAIVYAEVQKSLDCIMLIKQDINHYRTESQVLRKQLHLESSANERTRISNKIAANKERMAESEEHIFLINQRALVLQEQLRVLSLQSQAITEVF